MFSGLSKYRVNGMAWRHFPIMAALLVIAGCGGSRTDQVKAPDYVSHSARTLAIASPDDLFVRGDSQLAHLIGIELTRLGYSVIDTTATMRLLANDRIASVDVVSPQGLAALGKGGVDAVLLVSSAGSGMGGPEMRHVKVKLTSTRTLNQIGEINWHNSWSGMPGSPADYMARKGPSDAARAIADALAKLLG